MKRRVQSFIITLALCLNLLPVEAFASGVGADGGLCPHHPAHTGECGYALPVLEQECTHSHSDGCYTAETNCIHEHTAACYPASDDVSGADEPALCVHICTQDSGCITQTLACLHEHDAACGYAPGNPGAPCTFVCPVCPIEDLIRQLPRSVSAHNAEQVRAQIGEIYALYDELSGEEQRQVDLSPCADLLDQLDGMDSAILDDGSAAPAGVYKFLDNQEFEAPFRVVEPMKMMLNGYTMSAPQSTAIQVTEAGELYLINGGHIIARNGNGVEVQPDGILRVTDPDVSITSTAYALDVASGADVKLSAGSYSGVAAAIRTEDGDFDALLETGCVYFDTEGNRIPSEDMASARQVTVGQCMDHSDKSCTHDDGTTTHTWTCDACGIAESEPCTFDFQQDGTGTCFCGNGVEVVVDESDLADLVYDGTIKPEEVKITVTLTDGSSQELVKDTDYRVNYEPRKDAGEITMTVTGITFSGTFTKIYTVSQDRPALEWDTTAKPVPVEVDYDGQPVEAGDLPPVKINILSTEDNLQEYLQYSHKKQGDAGYTGGLPTDAGTYDVIVSLPEMQNFEAAVSDPLTLIINKISPIATEPAAIKPVYNGAEQELVTAGTLDPAAIADGLEIKFAAAENGTYSTAIPTGTNAGDYPVWYKVEVTDNYTAVGPTEITDVKIQRKQLTPDVTLSEYTYLYDSGYKEPKVTVKDGELKTVLPETEYQFEYVNNRNVSTPDHPAKVVVTDKAGGNYDLAEVEVPFQITLRTQESLSITEKPNTVTYGDQFILGTSGGSGNGLVTWEIIAVDGAAVAAVDQDSGQVTIIGDGKATVKATKSGRDPDTGVVNYEDATATWTLTASKKPVIATVTAENKLYDTYTTAIVHAVVEQGVLPGDVIKIDGLTGTFDNENAGVDKTVRVDTTGEAISGTNFEHYDISYSSLTVKAAIYKAIAEITTAPVPALLTYDGTEQELIATAPVVNPASVPVEYALSEDGPYSTGFPKGTNAGDYTVWYRIQETANYTGEAPQSVKVTIAKKPVNPTITLDQDSFVYDGDPKEPAVTLKEADGTLIPAGEYTVEYSGNVNVGTATVTVKAKDGGNYSFNAVTENFTIGQKQAEVLTAPEAAGDPLTFNTRAQKLVTAGAGSGGTMVYSTDNITFRAQIPTETNAGSYTVYYKVKGDGNHSDSEVGHVDVTIAPKTVKDPTITLFDENGDPLVSYTYDGNAKEPTATVVDGDALIGADEYEIRYANNIDAGNTATVNIIDKPNGNYTVTGSATFVIEKAHIVFDKAPRAAVITYDGKAHELLEPGETSGGEVQYALNSPTTTYTAAIPQATEAGGYTVFYKVVGDKNHYDHVITPVDVTIERKPLTGITIELAPESFVYDGTVKLPAVTVKDGKTVLPEEEYIWTCDVASPANQGTYTITISDAPKGNYDLTGVTANTATFSIGKTAQTELVIEGKPNDTFYGDTFTLSASGGSSSSAVTWSVTGPAAVDAATGEVEIIGVGEVTITATKPGGQNYLPVSDHWTFTAEPKPVTASIVVDDKAYDGTTDAAVTSASITAINGDTVTIDPASITAAFDTPGVGTGKTATLDTSKVQVTGPDAAKYDISYPDTVTADVTKATTTINTAPAKIDPLTYSGQPQALVTEGQTNVGFLVYSLDGTKFSPEVPTGTNAGTYTVYYKVDETADYTGVAVNATPIPVTIDPKPVTPTVELSESSFLYDNTKKDPKVTVKDGDTVIDPKQYTVTWANDDSTVTDGLLTAAGTYTATIVNVVNGNYSFTATAQIEIKAAAQGALKITGKPEQVYYGDTITTLEAAGGSGNGQVTWSIKAGGASAEIDPATGVLTITGTGSVTVEAVRTVSNYAPARDNWTFTVKPKPVVAEVTIAAKVYDGTTAVDNAAITASVKAGDLVDAADSIRISGLTGVYEDPNAGTGKTVTLNSSAAAVTGDTGKYTVSYPDTAKGTINPRSVTVAVTLSGNDLQTDNTVTPPAYSYTYDGTAKNPDVTVTAKDNNAVLALSDYSVSITGNKNVGNATVTVTAKAGGNYQFTDETIPFAIKKASAVLTSSPQGNNLTYDGTAQDLVTVGTATGGTVMYSGTGAEDSYSAIIPQGKDAGQYTVYYMVKGDANHEDVAPSQVSVTIKSREITPAIALSGDGLTEANGVYSYIYDGTAKTPTVTVTDNGDEISDTEYSVSYRDNVNAGTATVTVSDNNGGNYIVNGTATFEITRKAPAFTPPAEIPGLQYNGEAQELVTAGVCHEGTVVYSVNNGNYSTAIPVGTAVGTYTINYKVLGDANHSDTVPAALTVEIGKNRVTNPTISLSQDTFTYNGSQQKPDITVYDNNSRVIPEREYTVKIEGTNGNVGMVNVDTYTVTITTPDTSNYVINDDGTANVQTFKILPAGQDAISITGIKAQVHYGDTIQLGTTGGTGDGTVTWKIDGGTDTTLAQTGLLTVKDVNTPITVTATRSKGGNYGDVSATWVFTAGKKPVTAVLTGVNKPFDGSAAAAVKAKVAASDLVFGDTFDIPDLTGTFDNANVGTNKTITITGPAPAITDPKAANYEITYPATATASILAQAATVDTAPEAVAALIYDASKAQELVTAGTVTGGTLVYSLDGVNYTPSIPKAKEAGKHTVYYKAQGDNNHTDSAVGTVEVTIGKQSVTPQIELTPPSEQYDGNAKYPEVTVRDTQNNVIPKSEYKATYVSDSGENWTDKGTYKVRVENITGGNYIVDTATADFTISTSEQNPLEITGKPGLVYYGDSFTLSAVGGSGNSKVTWSSSDEDIAEVDANGFVTIKGAGSATITATKTGGGNYDTVTADYPLSALPKPVTAIVTADDKVFDGKTDATLHVTWEKGALVGDDEIKIETLTGTFEDERAGTNKTVTFTCTFVADPTYAKYDITVPPNTTASISKADATVPALTANNRVYDGMPQDLVTGGHAGTTLYSGSRDGVYTATVPAGTNADTYTVWYKEKGDANHNDSEPQSIQVTISRKTLTLTDANVTVELSGNDLQTDADGTYYYTYDGSEKQPSVIIKDGSVAIPASEYTASYSDNKNVGDATVTITNNEGGNYTVSGSMTFEIRKGSAELAASPLAKDLTYTGQQQELVTGGTATGGHIEYALDGGTYGEGIPKAADARTYTVTYKAVGDGNHEDSTTVGSVTVTIKPKEVISPKVTVSGAYTYDGNEQEPGTANVKVEDGGNTIPSTEYTLSYRDNINAGTATVIITNANGGNYIVNGTGTFEIAKGAASVTTEPTGLENLPYNGTGQALIEAGTASNGTMVYALSETGEYTPAIPTGKAVGTYTVWYKAQGDSNHNDSAAQSVTASIAKNTVTAPTIQVTPPSVTFNGEKQEPAVTVKDDKGFVIDGSEYTVAYSGDLINVDKYTLTITEVTDGNYTFDGTAGKNTAEFEILPADQKPLTITGTRERVYYGDTIQLGTTGGDGTIAWTVSDSTIASITNGLLTITGVGSVTVTATSTKPGYADQTAAWPFYADKKPVTAVVTAAAKTYDGDTTATVTAALNTSDLVGSDVVKITLSGSFEDPNAGTDKKVTVDSSNPDFTGSNGHENYLITYPATATASIFKANVDETKVTAPTEAANLEYTGLPLTLVDTAGSSTEGTMEYSLDNRTYSASLPTGTSAGGYEVWYRVKGDSNHNDTAGTTLGTVTIAPQTVTNLTIEFNPGGASYDGKEHKPAVTVKDNNNRVIPATEYTVDYGTGDWTKAGDYEVKVTAKGGGNYTFTEAKKTFTILAAGQSPLSITNKPGKVQYGDSFTLSAVGGSITGAVAWASSDPLTASIDGSGLVTVHKSGSVTITAKKVADGNYGEVSDTWSFRAEKKTVTPIVTAKDKEYDGYDTAKLVITWKDGDLLNGDTINLDSVLTGKFSDANVGTNKTVTVTGTLPSDDRYDIKFPPFPTASITPKAASLTGATNPELTYDGNPQPLVTGVTATNGTLAYSRNGAYYILSVPKETNAGTYTVWYKAQADADGNYKDSPAICVEVTIAPKPVTNPVIELSSETFDYDGTAKKPDVVVKDGTTVIPASEYDVSYSNNVQIGTNATVTITAKTGGNYNVSGSRTFTIKAGSAALKDAPKPNDLTYNGFKQELVTPGTAVNGKVVYSTTENGSYSTSIPGETNAGVYQIWYKVQGDNGAGDTEPKSVIVEIKQKLAYPTVKLELASNPLPYTGTPQEPPVTVSVNSVPLDENTYTVTYSNNINPGRAEVTVQSTGGNYQFKDTTAFYIAKSKAAFAVPPEGRTDLVYTGEPQELIEEFTGTSLEGIVVYSQNAVTYSAEIPTGTKVRTYTIFAKVLGDSKHEDSAPITISATISKNVVNNPKVTLSQNSFKYDGSEHKPTVTVTDDNGNVIPAGEYDTAYSDNINVGTATVTIKNKGTNYQLDTTATFQIVDGSQPILTITGKRDSVVYGDTLYLGATGGTEAVAWSSSDPNVAAIDSSTGVVTTKKSGSVTITATSGSLTDTWTFTVAPKPVTAVVIAAEKSYDTNMTATLTVILSGLVAGDSVDTVTAMGHFMDANAGTNKTVMIDSLTIPDGVKEKYTVTAPATTTGTISPAAAKVTDAPEAVPGLTYTGSPQALVTGGTADGGNMMYSLDGGDYSYNLPTAADAGSYTVWYKAAATDGNHTDSVPKQIGPVTVSANTNPPTVKCSPSAIQYDGKEKTPTVTVTDSGGRIIPESEYTVTLPSPRIAVGKYTVTVTDNPGGNYQFASPVTGTFEIVASSQNPLSITDKPADIRYGDTFNLSATGGSGSGAIHWSIKESNGVAEIDEKNGTVTVTGVGSFTVEAYREAADGYSNSNTDSVRFTAKPKPVTPVVTIKPKNYDGNIHVADDAITVTVRSSDLAGGDSIAINGLTASYDSANAGTNKMVMLDYTNVAVSGTNAGRYVINWPDSVTGTIDRVDARLAIAPKGADLTYSPGTAQNLIAAGTGTTVNNIGTVEYSTSQNGVYSEAVPTGTNAGTYTVWYKVADSVNYTGIAPASIEVEIKKGDPVISTYPTASGTEGQTLSQMKLSSSAISVPGSFGWKDGSIRPGVGTSEQYVVFTPDDTANYNTVEFQIDVTVQAATATGGGTTTTPPAAANSTPAQTDVRDGTAITAVSAADGDKLVQEAVENQSRTIVIKPEITGDVTKTKVSIPASTVGRIQSETNASLTVSTPIADAAIPREALDTLAGAGGDVSVSAEQAGQAVTFTLTAGGETVERVPGGLTLTVPAEDAGPGTVAMLVHEDGTREVIQRSIVEDGRMSIPLDGSATVEIVDNGRVFADVPPENWASEAVTFASARELFSGTSETTFSPDETMSRAMLATVLYRLEGQPEKEAMSAYSDVSDGAWYADSVAWAVENGIVNGYGDGQFGPNDSVTREQFVVMLWRYVGSPTAGRRDLDFADAEQVSGYAREALCWAVENGVLKGSGKGRLVPGGTATRAEAAQMLKNFMENT